MPALPSLPEMEAMLTIRPYFACEFSPKISENAGKMQRNRVKVGQKMQHCLFHARNDVLAHVENPLVGKLNTEN